MALAFLNCSICPKQPSFSDTSHLLTHVSSKGHLSEWHKLQVRSFQDIAAGVALATYNQWCQQHDIDRLLSERMQMKEDKQARKRKTTTARNTSSKAIPIDHALLGPSNPSKRSAKSKTQGQRRGARSRRERDDDGSDSDFSPVKRPKRKAQRQQIYSPVRRPHLPEDRYAAYDDCPAEPDLPTPLQVLATPEHIKLKGTVWPGMDLFDAATQEMQQKRNQKKDASVLRRMERLAGLVEPTEVVYSPGGESVLKARHIDDLEDASSLIEGETPVPKVKQPRSRKRKPLAETDVNAPRLVRRKALANAPQKYDDLPFANGLPPLPYLPSSSTGDSYGTGSRFFPTEEDDDDIKPSIEFPGPRKRPPPQFEIFTDGSPRQHLTSVMNGARNPLQSDPRGNGTGALPQLSKVSAAWLQPPYQSALQYTDPYTAYRPVSRHYQAFYDPSITNENIPPLAEPPVTVRGSATNPLSWKSPTRAAIISGFSPSDSPFGGFFGIFSGGSPGDDPFVSSKNPLAGALAQLESEKANTPSKENSHSSVYTGLTEDAEPEA